MKTVVACNSIYGKGGLGQHFAQVVEEMKAQGILSRYYCKSSGPYSHLGVIVDLSYLRYIFSFSPLRFSPEWRGYAVNLLFDLEMRRCLDEIPEAYIGFAGQAKCTFERLRSLGTRTLILHSPTAHIEYVDQQHRRAAARLGVEGSWLNSVLINRILAEYEEADLIYVNSDYVRQSFLQAGVVESKLALIELKPHSRFKPIPAQSKGDVFRVVYSGGLTQSKGVPVLVDAFFGFDVPNAELVLVGGWSTSAMRRYMQKCMERDPRIRISPGDPLPELQRAAAYVHPSYQDGLGYAPLEALACGVPVIVSEDTGMKEKIRDGVNGFVVPTGDSESIREKLEHLYSLWSPVKSSAEL